MFQRLALWLACLLPACLCFSAAGRSATDEASRYTVEDRRSGHIYLTEENQRLQDDDFANPGLLWVERGRTRWHQADGAAGNSCASCHAEATDSMRGVRTRYPRFEPTESKLINLAQQINHCRVDHMQTTPFAYESEALLDLTSLIGFASRG